MLFHFSVRALRQVSLKFDGYSKFELAMEILTA